MSAKVLCTFQHACRQGRKGCRELTNMSHFLGRKRGVNPSKWMPQSLGPLEWMAAALPVTCPECAPLLFPHLRWPERGSQAAPPRGTVAAPWGPFNGLRAFHAFGVDRDPGWKSSPHFPHIFRPLLFIFFSPPRKDFSPIYWGPRSKLIILFKSLCDTLNPITNKNV